MTEFERVLETAGREPIRDLDLSMFSEDDIANVVLQRSQILIDQKAPGAPIRDWTHGNETTLRDLVATMGDELVRRALGLIYLEYLDLKPLLTDLKPRRIADIGCGYAFFDLFVQRDFGSHLVLIDLEQNDGRHFDFRKTAAAYTSLDVAHAFLTRNGCAADRVETVNPQLMDVNALRDIDLAVSLLSCGFHYPWDTYAAFFDQCMAPGGSIVLDLRTRFADRVIPQMETLGKVQRLGTHAAGKAQRVQIVKHARQMTDAA